MIPGQPARNIHRRELLSAAGFLALCGCGGPQASNVSTPSQAASSPRATPSLSPTPSRSEKSGGIHVRLMTFNIMTATKKSISDMPSRYNTSLAWISRVPAITARIAAQQPTILCLQENEAKVDNLWQADYVLKEMPQYERSPYGKPSDPVQILFSPQEFEANDGGLFKLNTRGLNGAPKDRFCAWARLSDRSTGREFLVMTAHLTSSASLQRAEFRAYEWTQFIEGVRRIDPQRQLPLVLCGDFNATEDETRDIYDAHIKGIDELGLRNARSLARLDSTAAHGAASMNLMGDVVDGKWYYGLIRMGAAIDYICVPAQTGVAEWQTVLGSGPAHGVTRRWIASTERAFFTEYPIGSDHNPVFSHFLLW